MTSGSDGENLKKEVSVVCLKLSNNRSLQWEGTAITQRRKGQWFDMPTTSSGACGKSVVLRVYFKPVLYFQTL